MNEHKQTRGQAATNLSASETELRKPVAHSSTWQDHRLRNVANEWHSTIQRLGLNPADFVCIDRTRFSFQIRQASTGRFFETGQNAPFRTANPTYWAETSEGQCLRNGTSLSQCPDSAILSKSDLCSAFQEWIEDIARRVRESGQPDLWAQVQSEQQATSGRTVATEPDLKSKESRKQKKGRKPATPVERAADAEIVRSWNEYVKREAEEDDNGRPSLTAFARTTDWTEREVRLALDRHAKRQKRRNAVNAQ